MRSGNFLYVALAAALLGLVAPRCFACTTFEMPQTEGKIVGNSFDWLAGTGAVYVNKRHQEKAAFALYPDSVPAKWTSRYGSVTINQHGRELPLGGMNEAGLVIEIMWLDRTRYPKVGDEPSVNELQWIQYHLDRFDRVSDVVKSAKELKIRKVYANVHYLACDATGDCAAIEFLKGEATTHSGPEMLVNTLTNDTYEESLQHLKQQQAFGGTETPPPSGSHSSLDRFVTASLLAKAYRPSDGDPVAYAFKVLDQVRQGRYSKFNAVYDRKARELHLRTLLRPEVKTIDLGALDFSCKTPSRMLDVNGNIAGNVTGKFVEYTRKANRGFISVGLGALQFLFPHGAVDRLAAYPESFGCND